MPETRENNLNLHHTLIRLVTGLEAAGFDYAIGGGIALGFWATPRATLDIDIGTQVDPFATQALFSTLRNIGCEFDANRAAEAVERGHFDVRLEGIRVDISGNTACGKVVKIDTATAKAFKWSAAGYCRQKCRSSRTQKRIRHQNALLAIPRAVDLMSTKPEAVQVCIDPNIRL